LSEVFIPKYGHQDSVLKYAKAVQVRVRKTQSKQEELSIQPKNSFKTGSNTTQKFPGKVSKILKILEFLK